MCARGRIGVYVRRLNFGPLFAESGQSLSISSALTFACRMAFRFAEQREERAPPFL
jgi:hypothetical protein